MASDDPWRETFLEILRELNRAEANHDADAPEQALELGELETRLAGFWAVQAGQANVPRALGLLVVNGFASPKGDETYSWERQRSVRTRYQITAAGKEFLSGSVETADRIR